MKFSRKYAACVAVLLAAAASAELAPWVQHIEAGALLDTILFRTVALPSGPVLSRRPPAQTVPELSQRIAADPKNVDLVRARAREYESLLNFKAAEANWRQVGLPELADYYHRRLQPREELATLLQIAQPPSYERALALAAAQAMPVETMAGIYRAWISRDPKNAALYSRLFDYLASNGSAAEAEAVLADYQKIFPGSLEFPIAARARLARTRGSAADALAVYDRAFEPLWNPGVIRQYFNLLNETRGLRKYLGDARAQLAANPADVEAAARIFYYYQQAGNLPEAHRTLREFAARNATLPPESIFTIAQLFEQTLNYAEAARFYSRLDDERGLAGVIRVLFAAPEERLPIENGDITFYRDVASMDPGPGTLNGILSLLFNSTEPRSQFAGQERKAVAYFHRAKAAELLTDFDRRYPQSKERQILHARLVAAYAAHGASDGVIRAGREYLGRFADSPFRTEVALHMADAYAGRNQVNEEFAIYDSLLKELAAKADGVPLGSISQIASHEQIEPVGQEPGYRPRPVRTPVRSQDYANVLARYLGRLASMKRVKDALAVYRTEIDRNPNDPGLYEGLAGFLDQNKMAADVEQVYRRATQQFQDRTWYHKLARWYLRHKQTGQFEQLSREVVKIFSGTDLERYFSEIIGAASLDNLMYRQLNLFAHQRFPHDLVFARNLLSAYTRRATADPVAYERLLRDVWFYAPDLRSRFFELLSRTNRLEAEIAALQSSGLSDRAVRQFIAEARNWQSHFEQAASPLTALAANYSGNRDLNTRAASLHRSLGNVDQAASIEQKLSRLAPRDTATLARIGEIYADEEQFDKARPHWDRIAAIEPGKPEGYLEAATVFWDYYQFDDALRLIQKGRTKLKQPALYAYEAGAIYENRRDYGKAIDEYLAGAAAAPEGSAGLSRLLVLARRPALRDTIERRVAGLSAPAAFPIRVALLEAAQKRDELDRFLQSTASSTDSFELLAKVDETASRLMFPEARRRSLERQIQITPDPVEKIRLRIDLARHFENNNNPRAAQAQIESLVREHGRIAGVVRASTNYFMRAKNPGRAVDVLEDAAKRSNPEWRRRFTLEASVKATEAGDVKRARRLLEPVLKAEPLAPDVIAAMAATYGKTGDDRGLRAFYSAKLEAAGPEQKVTLRRSLIPILTRLGDHAEAVSQYIEIMNRYPQDQALIEEAANYARKHGRTEQLAGYYVKTVQDSAKDVRWPAVLARVQSAFENYPAAIEAYNRATAVRPDRTDLHIERAALEERLLRFDEAHKSYTQIYNLTYKDPRWMVKAAEVRARQGRPDEALSAVRAAFIEGRNARAQDYFESARLLESWRMLTRAKELADVGLKLSDGSPEQMDDLRLFIRVAARLRQHEAAWSQVSALAEYDEPLAMELASTVDTYFTPEEKQGFAAWLERQRTGEPGVNWVSVAQSAGLQETAVRWMAEGLAAQPNQAGRGMYFYRLTDTQQRRLRFDELAQQTETLWRAYPEDAGDKHSLLAEAARNYRLAGSEANELRVLTLLDQRNFLGSLQQRYHQLLLARAPEQLVAQAARGIDAAAQIAVNGNDPSLALRAVQARGGYRLPPVWTKSHTALTGLYFGLTSPDVETAFTAALGPATVGEQLGRQVDRNEQLAGDIWFYYGSRYGEWLGRAKRPNSDDYLPAGLEGTPERAAAYVELARSYMELLQPAKALKEYEYALQIEPERGDIYNEAAVVLASQGRMNEAVEKWKQALTSFHAMQNRGFAPESFWTGVSATLDAIGRYKQMPALRQQADELLRAYIRRNGSYRVQPLLEAALSASGDIDWILDLSRSAASPSSFLAGISEERWIPEGSRDRLFERLLIHSDEEVARFEGPAREQAAAQRRQYRMRYLDLLLDRKQAQKAQALLSGWRTDFESEHAPGLPAIEARVAAQAGQLPQLLRRFEEKPPQLDTLRAAAAAIRQDGDAADARLLLEWVYTRELALQDLSPANFLGLAEVKLEGGDAPAALALLRRMALVSGEPFVNLPAAAALLEKYKRPNEAREFRETYARAVPWDFINMKPPELAAAAEAPYELRVQAAKQLNGQRSGLSGELALLAAATPPAPADAEKPLYFHARVESARTQSDPAVRVRLLRGAIEIDPGATAARVDLMRAAFDAKRPVLATSALYSVLFNSSLRFRLEPPEGAEERGEGPIDYAAREFLNSFALTAAERARIARDLAAAYRNQDRLPAAETLLRISAHLDPAVSVAADLEAIGAEQKARKANEQRRPRIHRGLDQEHPVRPRLLAQAGGTR